MLSVLLLPLLLLALAQLRTDVDTPGDWIEYTPGTCNVVISSPHGGTLRPSLIADRTHGCLAADGVTCRWEKGCRPATDGGACRAASEMDIYSLQVAALIVKHLSETYNCMPHFVRANLHRSKLDPNRPIEEAAQGDPLSQEAWRTYHDNFMVTAVESVRSRFGRGLVFDIHGQAHAEQWTEIGYLLSKAELNSGLSNLTGSSIRSLAARSLRSPTELIIGSASFGSLLESRGYVAVPGPTHPSPGNGNYYTGGYITRRYGSRLSGNIDAIQLEIARNLRADPAKRERFAADLASVINDFMVAHGYKVGPTR